MFELSLVELVKRGATVSPTESEIAKIAYQLWLENGCPFGSDQEDWFRAEARFNSARSTQRGDTRTKCDMVAEFRWEGHWEVWEREWGGARWIEGLGLLRAVL